jgi:phosphatidylserine/phosphatidylglycerophosphate/cardiolipin synthase-like enzyme
MRLSKFSTPIGGWGLALWLGLALGGASDVVAFPVDLANAPASNLTLTVGAILSAKQQLQINIYELTSPEIGEAIVQQLKAGVQITLLQEGQPVGGLSEDGKAIQAKILTAMRSTQNGSRLLSMSSSGGAKRRYRFDHAKYVIVDGKALLIGSENYSPGGQPKIGAQGNRGWEVILHDPELSAEFSALFTADSDTSYGDVLDLTAQATEIKPVPRKKRLAPVRASAFPRLPGVPRVSAQDALRITSPETSLDRLIGLIQGARLNIEVEQMVFDSRWTGTEQNPLIAELIHAAKRGVKVRVLLNDEVVFSHGSPQYKPINPVTRDLLNEAARQGNLPIEARIANVKAMGVGYIHNKGMLIDGNQTLISSINWVPNSILNNRETAVVVQGPAVNAYYRSLFSKDWAASRPAVR